MRKPSTLQCALLRFGIPLMLLVSFYCATSAEVSELNTEGKLVNEDLTKTNLNGHDEEEKFKFFHHHKPIFKKPIPVVKPVPVPVYKPIPKPVPILKPIPIVKPIPVVKPVPIPVYKPIPKPIPIYKPIPKPIPIYKPIPKPFIVKKPIPAVEPEEFLKPKPFFKKPIPKLPHHPKFEKPHLPHFPIHKPIHKPIPTP